MTNVCYSTLAEAEMAANRGDLEEGAVVYITEPNVPVKIFTKGKLIDMNANTQFNMSIYELNKQIFAQQPVKTDEELREIIDMLNDFRRTTPEGRMMLLCRDINYYTIFEQNQEEGTYDTFGLAVIDTIDYIGDILDANPTEENAVEIWFKDFEGEAHVMYLFNCEEMFVDYRGY